MNEELKKLEELLANDRKTIEDNYKEIEKLKEELEYTIPIVEHNKTITKHLKEIERLNNIIKYLEQYFSEREYYEFAQLVRETKQANIEWLKNAIKEEK